MNRFTAYRAVDYYYYYITDVTLSALFFSCMYDPKTKTIGMISINKRGVWGDGTPHKSGRERLKK